MVAREQLERWANSQQWTHGDLAYFCITLANLTMSDLGAFVQKQSPSVLLIQALI